MADSGCIQERILSILQGTIWVGPPHKMDSRSTIDEVTSICTANICLIKHSPVLRDAQFGALWTIPVKPLHVTTTCQSVPHVYTELQAIFLEMGTTMLHASLPEPPKCSTTNGIDIQPHSFLNVNSF